MECTSIPAGNTSDPAGVSSERMFVHVLSVQQEGLKVKGTKDIYRVVSCGQRVGDVLTKKGLNHGFPFF